MHWTIIGGGLQGTIIALKLKNEGLKNRGAYYHRSLLLIM